MGIRFASGRHANVVVMAPALTETAQTQSFKFVTSPSRSPSLSLKNHLKKKRIQPEEVLPKQSNGINNLSGMNGHSPVSKTTYSINGLAKSLKNEFLQLDQKKEESDAKSKPEGNYSITQIGGYMMNSGFMGDPDMGLQKSNKDLCEGEKISPEVDQLIKNFVTEELGSTPELNQNVEEIFKAISTLDPSSNEIESGPSGDNMFPDMSAALSSFERGLFNEVDIMNMCVDETLVAVNKDTIIRERIEDVRKRQFQFNRKFDFLMRRLKKLQAKTIGKHVAEEITGVIEYSSNLLEASSRLRGFPSGDNEPDIKCDIKSVSFSSMSLFMRQMEHAVNQQTNTVARNSIRQCKYFGSGSSPNSLISTSNGVRSSLPGSVLPPFPTAVQRELATTAGELKSQLVKIQQDIDSDVTESSSGCESCDEFISYNNTHQHQLSISKRASWKWAEERALIASKWTWLQSQIADLEYKIRQQTEIKRSIRAAKGSLKFQIEQGVPTSLPNGCNSEKGDTSCSRTRGLVKSSFGKRKLLQLNGLHRTCKKAARSASLRCSCSSTLPGCGLCTGRSEPGQPQEPISTLPVSQRVAFLDPGFHPILSFPQDVCSSTHYDAVMKCTDWQSKASRIQGKTTVAIEDKNRAKPPPSNDSPVVDLQRSKAAALAVSVKLRRKIVKGKKRRRAPNLSLDRYRHRRKHSTGLSGVDSEDALDQDVDASGSSRYPSPVPSPAPAHPPTVSKDKEVTFKRKRENSYDIDNIVIPYSMASSTRLEKLNYKEIPTPKWRIVSRKDSFDDPEQKNGIIRRSSHENPEVEEDNSDEAAVARHERCQIDEKKRFLSYLKLPGGLSRGRAQRRTDSRADSSGPNTPENMSPRDDTPAPLILEPVVITSPPSTSCDTTETGRRRTISSSQIPTVISEVEPYERRKFPLSEEEYRKMVESGDYQHPPPNNSSYQSSAAPVSPGSVSTDSAESFVGEDPNDPEWTTNSTVDRTNCKR